MESINVTAQAYLSASIIGLILVSTYTCHWITRRLPPTVPLASLAMTVWLGLMTHFIGTEYSKTFPATVVCAQALYYFLWISAFYRLIEQYAKAPKILFFIWIGSLAVSITVIVAELAGYRYYQNWLLLSLSLTSIVFIEQLYRSTTYNRYIKLLGLCLGIVFIFDTYICAYQLFSELDRYLLQARAALMIIVFALMSIGAIALPYNAHSPAKINLSRPLVFYTTSIAIVGIMGSLLVVGGYYIRLYSGKWGNLIYSGGLFLAIILIAIVYTSSVIRDQITVFINKHLFLHKYDYRTEWLKLINRLSNTTNKDEAYQQALDAVSSLFKSAGGLLWLKHGPYFELAFSQGEMPIERLWREEIESDFCRVLLEEEWIFIPGIHENSTLNQFNTLLPNWVSEIEDAWFIMPLISNQQLIGFIILTKPLFNHHLTWEDLDLIKAAGRQVADYLYRQQQAQELTEAQQFETFSRLTAFVMHDLKNLIAQQALVVDNATKHKNNPEFIEDAIHTIDNSVQRMNNLLKKLQRDIPEEITNFSLKALLTQAVHNCEDKRPAPSLRLCEGDFQISGDFERLSMAITHLIQNAQDATNNKDNAYVDVSLNIYEQYAMIEIEDNGSGMSKQFIRDKLFKPFETTKSGKGMGIGVYQARSIIHQLNGELSVNSTMNEGTTFTVTLPGIPLD